MYIKRITPEELPSEYVFYLEYRYHVELSEFIVMVDDRKEILFVNKEVPQRDIDGFVKIITFPEYWVCDDESPTGEILDYVYKKYGHYVYMALTEAHAWRMEQKEKKRAAETAEKIIPLIEKEINNENPIVKYDEFLAHEIWKQGYDLNRPTPNRLTNYGNMYEFYFGYLLGSGALKDIIK